MMYRWYVICVLFPYVNGIMSKTISDTLTILKFLHLKVLATKLKIFHQYLMTPYYFKLKLDFFF